jgi:hypothetical protein
MKLLAIVIASPLIALVAGSARYAPNTRHACVACFKITSA